MGHLYHGEMLVSHNQRVNPRMSCWISQTAMVLLYINNPQHMSSLSNHPGFGKTWNPAGPGSSTRMSWTAASTLSARIRNLQPATRNRKCSYQPWITMVDEGMTWLGLEWHSVKVFYLRRGDGIHMGLSAGWWLTYPSEKWWSLSVGIMKFPTEGKNKHVPNHQPVGVSTTKQCGIYQNHRVWMSIVLCFLLGKWSPNRGITKSEFGIWEQKHPQFID